MEAIFKWCNENQGVLAAVAILVMIVPAMLGLIPKCVRHVQRKRKKKKEDAHREDLEKVVDYLRSNVVANIKKLAKALDKPEEDIQNLLSEFIDQGAVVAACNNCNLSDPNSVWELSK